MSKTIVLEKLTLKNFKGIKDLTIDFSNITNIYGDNATGKTTIFDAFTWLLFNKDSQDISKFDVQPLDGDNKVVHRVDTEVEAVLEINGVNMLLRKLLKEKWVKPKGKTESEFQGATASYYIDDVPKKEKEYKKKINEIIQEDIFKLLTNPMHFSTKMTWQERKNILMGMIGEITDQNVIDSKGKLKPLEELLVNKDIDELKKSINASRKKLIKDKESIPPRVDELRKSIRKEDIDFKALEFRKRGIVAGMKSVEEQLLDKTKLDDELFMKKDKLYGLKSKLKDIEHEEVEKAESGRDKIAQDISSLNGEIAELKFDIKSLEMEKNNNLKIASNLEVEVKNLRDKWYEEDAKVFELPEDARICPTCHRPFDEEDIESHRQEMEGNFKQNKSKILKSIKAQGLEKSNELEKYKERVLNNETALKNARDSLEKLNNEKDKLQSEMDNFKINIDLDSNKEYQDILRQVEEFETELSKPVESDAQIRELKERKESIEKELEEVNYKLGYREMNDRTNARIEELLNKEKELSQQIANLEKQEFLCDEFIKTKVELMETSINSKFKYVKFRFFKTLVNGGIEEGCEPLVDGVPFSTNLNSGARINAGIDIINTLSQHCGINAPIFIDNRESTTKLIDVESQVVNLVVSSKDKSLRIENGELAEEKQLAS
ncbi:AAA family ATPase [Clostridium kluyveri]|uniref:Nuclease SbcCD subunit C n=1 Tax=Clostridium kluyveri TaxID=1534 RepID=A0A1L5FBX0_CLOKL|nr:AAA family ATPase [Clostridium kluyveri]APM40506.1 recombinase RecF [Clostridium kluyveri]